MSNSIVVSSIGGTYTFALTEAIYFLPHCPYSLEHRVFKTDNTYGAPSE